MFLQERTKIDSVPFLKLSDSEGEEVHTKKEVKKPEETNKKEKERGMTFPLKVGQEKNFYKNLGIIFISEPNK